MILIQPYAQKMKNGKINPKNYPYWKELIELLPKDELIQIGVEGEEQLVPDFRKNLPFDELEKLVKECKTFIGVDSFLQHLAWYHGKKGVVIWGQSDPLIFGHDIHLNILKDRKYLREKQFEIWEQAEFNAEAFSYPQEVFTFIQKNGMISS